MECSRSLWDGLLGDDVYGETQWRGASARRPNRNLKRTNPDGEPWMGREPHINPVFVLGLPRRAAQGPNPPPPRPACPTNPPQPVSGAFVQLCQTACGAD